ncbi:MAG: serine hydrolase domain-containing protein [Anaerolineae bacterium]|nr:serine hydrolase [Chloroflexota bacterium]
MASELIRTTPEALGISSGAVSALVEALERNGGGAHSLMLLRHGRVAAEGYWAPYAADTPHMLFSLSKSFTSTAIGLAVAEGRLTIDDRVLSFFPQEGPAEPGAYLQAMRIRHLLSMTTGHSEDTLPALLAAPDGTWRRAFLQTRQSQAPGRLFCYNSGASYMLSAILQQVTGETVRDYLTPRLFEPLGIPQPRWETCPAGYSAGGWGLYLRTEDIARFGQLYLQRGRWEDRQLLPAAWVDAATRAHADNSFRENPDWRMGYGYQFWMCRHGAWRGDGAHGQFCLVMPEQDAVLALTSGVRNLQAVLDAVWEHLLPGMGDGTLPSSTFFDRALQQQLASLRIDPPAGEPRSPLLEDLLGKTVRLEEGDLGWRTLRLEQDGSGLALLLEDGLGSHRLTVPTDGSWWRGSTELAIHPARTVVEQFPRPVAVSGAWEDPQTLTVTLCFVETPFHPTLRLRVEGQGATLRLDANCGWDELQGREWRGTLE